MKSLKNILKRVITVALALTCTVTAVNFTGITDLSAKAYDEYDSYDLSDTNYFDIDYYYDDYYTGEPVTLDTEVYYDDYYDYIQLTEGTDYTVTYKNNVNAGTATAEIKGKGRFYGTRVISFEIYPASIWDVNFHFENDKDTFGYTGQNIKPKVIGEFNGKKLVVGKDFTVTYETNCSELYGDYTAKVQCKGNFEGSTTLYYYITPPSLNDATVSYSQTYTYTGSQIKPNPVVKYCGKTLVKNKDYYIEYGNNVNVGTGSFTIYPIYDGNYTGDKTCTFTIQPRQIKNLTVSNLGDQCYTGKSVCPKPKVYGDGKLLKENLDYKLTYKNNVNIGTASCTVTPTGNCKGTAKTFKFNIKFGVILSIKATTANYTIKLNWSKTPLANGYKVYKYDYSKKKWVGLKTLSGTSYTIKNLTCANGYKFSVVAYRKVNGKYQYGPRKEILTCTKPLTPTVTLKSYKNKTNISWTKNSRSQGYEIYWCGGEEGNVYTKDICYRNMAKLKTVNGNTGSYTKTNLSSIKNYHFKVRAYRTINGKKVYSNWSAIKCSSDPVSRLNAATRKTHSSYKLINVQGAKNRVSYHTLTSEEKRILSNFARTHFKKGWSVGEKIVYTAEWIRNTMYYGPIPTGSHTKNIFVYKKGQCSDYNGALVEMMTYLGLSPQLIQGTRSGGGQHFWGEIYIDGVTYLLEVGEKRYDSPSYNYKWEFICYKYSEKSEGGKYVKNGKYY